METDTRSRAELTAEIEFLRSHLEEARACLARAEATHLADINHRNRAEEKRQESEERLQAFIRWSRDGFIIIDPEGIVVEWSPGEEAITGISRGEALGRPLWELQYRLAPEERRTPEFAATAREIIARALAEGRGLRMDQEDDIVSIDGHRRFLHTSIFAIPSRGGIHVCGISRDITDRKRTEEELLLARDELELKVDARTAELAQALSALKEEHAERLRSENDLHEKERMLMQQNKFASMGEMINNIAHQWRQPLNNLGLHLQNLLFFYDCGEFTRDFLQKTTQDGMKLIKHMSQTIDDFRFFMRPNKDKDDFSLDGAIELTTSLVRDSFHSHRIEIEVQMENALVLNGYQNEFSQVLLNIMQNARDAIVEREVHGGKVTITTFTENGRPMITISDNGGGIPAEIVERIFEPYFSTKGANGTGIGLYMAKNIIETSMGGRISAFNTGEGAVVRIEL